MDPPLPEPGSIIRYRYGWFAEHEVGVDPDRPHPAVVLALAVTGRDRRTEILCLAITHAPPYAPDDAIEIPPDVRRAAGLDAFPQWVVIAESNVFAWPGPDLRPVPGRSPETVFYGRMPLPFLRTIALAFRAKNRGSGVGGRQVRT